MTIIFDHNLAEVRRNKIFPNYHKHNFLVKHCANELVDRLQDTSKIFPYTLDLGTNGGEVIELILKSDKVQNITTIDHSKGILDKTICSKKVLFDNEHLPFSKQSFDLIISNLLLHKINDLPGMLCQINQSLKYNGLFLGSMFGSDSLKELREILLDTEIKLNKPTSMHVFPFTDLKTMGMLMQRANFAMPVTDSDKISVAYPDIFTLLYDLQAIGESNFLISRSNKFLGKDFFKVANELYFKKYPYENYGITVTFDIIYLTALGNEYA